MADTELAAQIKAALSAVEIPGGGDLASYGGLSEIIVTPGAIAFAIAVATGMEAAFGPAREAAQNIVQKLGGGRKVMVSITAEKSNNPKFGHGPAVPQGKTRVKGVKRIIAVAAGTGGVGKSTSAVNIALALAAEGLKVGILDADLYGPSIPKLLGIEGRPAIRDDGIFTPHEAFGLKAMSIGSMLVPGQAVVWRGPMATSGLRQLLREMPDQTTASWVQGRLFHAAMILTAAAVFRSAIGLVLCAVALPIVIAQLLLKGTRRQNSIVHKLVRRVERDVRIGDSAHA